METQRFAIKGRVVATDDSHWQALLADVHDSPERPRCLCVAGGVEMYVARHRHYLLKRMPETGSRHHPVCPAYEPEAQDSGLGQLVGRTVVEVIPGNVELKVDFAWGKSLAGRSQVGAGGEAKEVTAPPARMSLRAITHYLFERAGLNRWSPAMAGKRNQGVLHKYLGEAAEDVAVKGVCLAERLYVPEPFNEVARAEIAQRRRQRLAVLQPRDAVQPLALVIGEYKSSETTADGQRVWIRHMPDTPLLTTACTWRRLTRLYAPMFEARDADIGHPLRLLLTALIRARREHTYEVEAASLMLASAHWIPLDGVYELPLIHALVDQGRRFIKPLRYDASSSQAFPNALLVNVGPAPVRLHVVSPFMSLRERRAKESVITKAGPAAWVWLTTEELPALPAASPR